jgi:hypothetical protein
MNAATASDEQIKRCRCMSGEQRLALALELHEMPCVIGLREPKIRGPV